MIRVVVGGAFGSLGGGAVGWGGIVWARNRRRRRRRFFDNGRCLISRGQAVTDIGSSDRESSRFGCLSGSKCSRNERQLFKFGLLASQDWQLRACRSHFHRCFGQAGGSGESAAQRTR